MPQTGAKRECPWPGPKPYKEEEAAKFFGRSHDVMQLRDLVRQQRLSVLTALSGVGKSSLIQAGLIPGLRLLREQGSRLGPTLLLSEWGLLRRGSPAALLIWAIRRDIDRLAKRVRGKKSRLAEDVNRLKAVQPPLVEIANSDSPTLINDLVLYVQALCESVGGLVIIIDQAEELLGSGLGRTDHQDFEREVLGLIGTLFRSEQRLRILLSLRQEYHGRLLPLSRHVDGLEKRLYPMEPMPRETVRTILESAQFDGVCLGRQEIATILSWIGVTSEEGGRERAVDLLRLQVLLVSLFRHAEKKAAFGDKKLEITAGLLEEFKGTKSPTDLARITLESYIDRLFEEARIKEPPKGPGRDLVRRVAVRMTPWLSSGGFKRHVSGEELLFNSLQEDFEILRVKGEAQVVQERLKQFLDQGDEIPLSLESEASDASRSAFLSGAARTAGWSIAETITRLAEAAVQAINLLCQEQVLKATGGGVIATYELIHDGFGPALKEWADRERRSLRDTLASVVSRRGESFHWKEIRGRTLIRNMSWLGCNVDRANIKDVNFKNCIFNGTVFIDCVFENCTFIDCELDGTVFSSSRVRDEESATPRSLWRNVTWKCSVARSAFLRAVALDGVVIQSSILDGVTMEEVSVDGAMRIEDSRMRFAQIFRFGLGNGNHSIRIKDCDLGNALYDNDPDDLRGRCTIINVLWNAVELKVPRSGTLAARPAELEGQVSS